MKKNSKQYKIVITGNVINATFTQKKEPTLKYLKTIAKLGNHKVTINQI